MLFNEAPILQPIDNESADDYVLLFNGNISRAQA